MADEKKFLDYEGLSSYHKKAKTLYDGTYAKKDDVKDVDLSNYVKSIDADKAYAKKSEVVDQETLKKVIAEAQHMKKEVVEALPNAGDGVANVIYLVKKAEGGETNFYDEYLLIDGKWELIGNTETKVDLSNYATKEELYDYVSRDEYEARYRYPIPEKDIYSLFKEPDFINPLGPSPGNYLRVWAGDELISEIQSPTEIKDRQFSDKYVTKVEMPSSIKSYGIACFHNNLLTSVVFPEGVTIVDRSAFAHGLIKSITFGNTIVAIYDNAFGHNKLESVSLPDSVKSVGERAFQDNLIKSITFSKKLTYISEDCFNDNMLESITIPDSIENVYARAFLRNPLKTVSINRNTKFESDSFPETTQIIYRD